MVEPSPTALDRLCGLSTQAATILPYAVEDLAWGLDQLASLSANPIAIRHALLVVGDCDIMLDVPRMNPADARVVPDIQLIKYGRTHDVPVVGYFACVMPVFSASKSIHRVSRSFILKNLVSEKLVLASCSRDGDQISPSPDRPGYSRASRNSPSIAQVQINDNIGKPPSPTFSVQLHAGSQAVRNSAAHPIVPS